MMKGLLKYISSIIFLLLTAFPGQAQDESQREMPVEQTEEKEPLTFYGFKTGINIGRFSDFIFKPERLSLEGSFDLNFGNKYFAVAEVGYARTNLENESYNYSSQGYFVKLGMDYNMLKAYPTDFLGVGLRLGRSAFKQEAKDVIIASEYWGNIPINIPTENISTYWLEGSLGLKTELFDNIYLGWSVLIKAKLSGGSPDFQPYNIPGYGNGINAINLGINYYIYYQIPYNREK